MNKAYQAKVTLLAVMAAAIPWQVTAADTYVPGAGIYKDGPAAPFSNWAGFYFGGHLGYEWGNVDYNTIDLFNSQLTRLGSFNADGVMGGGQLGYNFQSGPWVYGAEADLGGMSLSGSKIDVTPPFNNRLFSSSGGFYGDMTGRLGYALGPSLVYAKGGAAFVDAEFKSLGPVISATRSDTLWGWTAGGGIEQRMSADWSVKLEYQHFDFGGDTFDNLTSKPRNARQLTFSPTADAIAVGANYFVNPGYEPLK